MNKNTLNEVGFYVLIYNHLIFPKKSKHPNCILETGTTAGDYITPFYDPMIAKIISHGKKICKD